MVDRTVTHVLAQVNVRVIVTGSEDVLVVVVEPMARHARPQETVSSDMNVKRVASV